ncbi:hypothetical protein KIN20_000070 [Parelaphostrongylus tenuis]|uniref:Uncharacterized protein n=1 Tax=Parelaphostrongylus tenuis TaxID=148309 RepID=A0AAD5MAN1_PARTN|nr:hypothetical protein KIN20_000070 [Parelaphostrongylus tenuis]
MSILLILLPVLVHYNVPVHSNVIDSNASPKIEEQIDELPTTGYDMAKVSDNDDWYTTSSAVNGHVSRYPLPYWMRYYQKNPFAPYHTNIPYNLNLLNHLAYPYLNPLLYGRQLSAYQRYQYPWKLNYLPDSDIRFSYLMNNPQAAITYQGFMANK